jgi:hypothetical protein
MATHGKGHEATVKKTPKTKRVWNIVCALSTLASAAFAIICNAFASRLALEAARHHALPSILLAAMILTAACSYMALYLSTWEAIIAGRIRLILIPVVLFTGLSSLNSSAIRAVFQD